MNKTRLDLRLVADGLAPSPQKAQALILSGVVLVNDTPVTKAGAPVKADAFIRIKGGPRSDWASRGALKLAPALEDFGVSVAGRVCLDLGASTGGFSDVLLRKGAARIYAVDVGYGQLVWRIQSDERVVVLDRTNARKLTKAQVPEAVSLVVCDVSFISVRLIFEALVPLLAENAELLVMVKPQFEVAKGRVGKGGVVRDPALRLEAIDAVAGAAREHGLVERGRRDNDISGPRGNLETFLYLQLTSFGA